MEKSTREISRPHLEMALSRDFSPQILSDHSGYYRTLKPQKILNPQIFWSFICQDREHHRGTFKSFQVSFATEPSNLLRFHLPGQGASPRNLQIFWGFICTGHGPSPQVFLFSKKVEKFFKEKKPQTPLSGIWGFLSIGVFTTGKNKS